MDFYYINNTCKVRLAVKRTTYGSAASNKPGDTGASAHYNDDGQTGTTCVLTSPANRINNNANQPNQYQTPNAHLANGHNGQKQRGPQFVPPAFPAPDVSAGNRLIKPSEYLRSLGGRNSADSEDYMIIKLEDRAPDGAPPPLPPPLPTGETALPFLIQANPNTDTKTRKQQQPLSAISIQDLHSVQLRRTDKMLGKTFSAPARSASMQSLTSAGLEFADQKTDLIAELKMSKDITGIKKMKVERAKMENIHDKEFYSEFTKQFTANNFVEKIPERDPAGNTIPEWKRQMLAKKAAERARKELEQQLIREAEQKRQLAIPAWKRQLLAKKEENESKLKATLYTPRVNGEDSDSWHRAEFSKKKRAMSIDDIAMTSSVLLAAESAANKENDANGHKDETSSNRGRASPTPSNNDDAAQIIPWRAQLRKTNSRLSLID